MSLHRQLKGEAESHFQNLITGDKNLRHPITTVSLCNQLLTNVQGSSLASMRTSAFQHRMRTCSHYNVASGQTSPTPYCCICLEIPPPGSHVLGTVSANTNRADLIFPVSKFLGINFN